MSETKPPPTLDRAIEAQRGYVVHQMLDHGRMPLASLMADGEDGTSAVFLIDMPPPGPVRHAFLARTGLQAGAKKVVGKLAIVTLASEVWTYSFKEGQPRPAPNTDWAGFPGVEEMVIVVGWDLRSNVRKEVSYEILRDSAGGIDLAERHRDTIRVHSPLLAAFADAYEGAYAGTMRKGGAVGAE